MITYRRDIDGLRSIAILSVLMYHAGLGNVTGGYTGVDIFFVISGFLITSILYRDIRDKKFSIVAFYERRIRRIFPALMTVLTVSSVIGWFVLLPFDYKIFGRGLVGAVAFFSNFVMSKAGYFDQSSLNNPLLHTWSLAVEEQFYIFFPLILWGIYRFGHKKYSIFFIVLSMMSFIGAVALLETGGAVSAFYMLPSRAWELLVGSLLALGVFKPVKSTAVNTALSVIAVALMGTGFFMLNDGSTFPGVNALFPCVGAALFIYAGERAFANRVMSLSPFVFIGKISYSLYLWHWPLLVFAKYYTMGDLPREGAWTVVVGSCVLSVLSWKYVETPFRKKTFLKDRKKLFIAAAVAMIILAGFGTGLKKTGGLPGRFGEDVQRISAAANDTDPMRDICHYKGNFPDAGQMEKCFFGDTSKPFAEAVIIGDSHAGSIPPMLDAVFKKKGIKALEITSSTCPPLKDISVRFVGSGVRESGYTDKCRDFNQKLFDYLAADKNIKTVILHARWGYYTTTTEVMPDDKGNRIFLTDGKLSDLTPENSAAVFDEALDKTIRAFKDTGKKAVIIADIPEMPFSPSFCLVKSIVFNKQGRCTPTTFKEYLTRQKNVFETFLNHPEVPVFYPHETFCEGDTCMIEKDGNILYSDDDHISVKGAMTLVPAFEKFWKGITK